MEENLKRLLLQDLCSRFPYGVMVLEDIDKEFDGGCVSKLATITEIKGEKMFLTKKSLTPVTIEEIRPYLRTMSSMTEEEKHKLLKFGAITCLENGEVIDVSCVGFERHADVQDYLNTCHFDYRGLIEKGLAIEVTEENNPYRE